MRTILSVGIKRSKAIEREPGRFLIVCFLDHSTVAPGEISHANAKTLVALGMLLTEIVATIPAGPAVPIVNRVLPDAEAVINQVIREQMEEVAKMSAACRVGKPIPAGCTGPVD
jgi:hypothetical protein